MTQLWLAIAPALAGTVVAQTLIQRGMWGLDPRQAIAVAPPHEDATLGAYRWVMAGITTTPLIFAIVATVLAWLETTRDLDIPLTVMGLVALLVQIGQGAWVYRSLPRIAADPMRFGPTLVIEVILEIPAILALVFFILRFEGII